MWLSIWKGETERRDLKNEGASVEWVEEVMREKRES